MAKPGEYSIRKKLMWVILLTSSSALMMSAIGFVISDWYSLQNSTIERLYGEAGIIGNNSVAALTFDDPDSATRTLSTLKARADIVIAALFTGEGEGSLFASYRRDSNAVPIIYPDKKSGSIGGRLFVISPIILEGDQIGSTLLVSDLSYWKQRQLFHLFAVLLVLFFSLVVALILSSRLQRVVSEPVLKLAETARRITEANDYSLRAKKLSMDEIGRLVDDFNSMLEQIQLQDQELKKVRENLEDKVEDRTQELTELARQLEHQAYHDTLTGLANRITFDDHLKLAINQYQRYGGQLAVLFLDLDRFKIVNDTLGHAVGDRLLIQVARKFSACTRSSDTLARLGGDEFAVLLMNVGAASEAAEVANKLIKALEGAIEVDGYSLHMTTSIGIGLFPTDGDSAETILKCADTAMYLSKELGRNQISFFSPEMNIRALRRLSLENKLRQVVRDDRLNVYYQPRLDSQTLDIIGVEALVRWTDPEEGQIAPAEFIPLAEDCGLIGDIDEWVLKSACIEVLKWFEGGVPGITLAVNVSPTQFIRKDLHSVIKKILEQTNYPGSRLELEVTESLFGPNSIDALSILKQLGELGVEISVDDFGTAYSSLSRLKQLPLHTLKIDQSFVCDLGKNPDDEAIVRTIVTLAHNLNLKVVAEGVETETQYNFVKRHGCDAVQGFLFAKPVPGDEMQKLLVRGCPKISC
jgi:diguanylate cyclase (GGDEF)-like protein